MEFVLVIPRSALFPECFPHGFEPFGNGGVGFAEFLAAIDRHGFFVERERAEREPDWKQIIPYVATSAGATTGESLFVMRRLKRGGEARLHGKRSIGVGGHVNPEDVLANEPRSRALLRGALREIDEEIALDGGSSAPSPSLTPLGLINDDATAVGAVHVGLACVLHTVGRVAVREHDVLEGELLTPDAIARLRADGADFESWSSFLLDALFPTASSGTTPSTGATLAHVLSAAGTAHEGWSLPTTTREHAGV